MIKRFEKRTENSYTMIDWNHWYNVYCERKKRGIESCWDFHGAGSENRTYDKIPTHKMFDFLRKAFEQCPWGNTIKKFKYKNNPDREYHVDCIYWDYHLCGYILCALIHYHINNEPNHKSHATIIVKNVNCIDSTYVEEVKMEDVIEVVE